MSYLLYVAYFGGAVVILLWLRDARIFFRTGLPGTGRRHTTVYCTGHWAHLASCAPSPGIPSNCWASASFSLPCTCRAG